MVLASAEHVTTRSGRRYFHPRTVRWDLVHEANTGPCVEPWGPERTFDVNDGGRCIKRAAWCYPEPRGELMNLKNLITFGNGIVIVPVSSPPKPPSTKKFWKSMAALVGRTGN
jgi:uncharacterized protein (DUF427 family)